MGLITRKNQPFTTVSKNSAIQGDNIVFIKGGSTIIGDTWVQFNDIRVYIKDLVDSFIASSARRVFNVKNGVLYVLITVDKDSRLEVVPSVSLNQTVAGNVKVFSSLSGRLPLILVQLVQDGSDNLSSYLPITSSSYEVFKGYGNFTLSGNQGETGPQGDTGLEGLEGLSGITGLIGFEAAESNIVQDSVEEENDIWICVVGYSGVIQNTVNYSITIGPEGLRGATGIVGDTGIQGSLGVSIARFVHNRPVDPVADFSGYPLTGVVGLSGVQFTNLSTGSWDSALWVFGDGNSFIDNSQGITGPVHYYGETGTYDVILYLYSIDYEVHKTKYDYITVTS
jgi:hypothetical protein